jgi:hypothetical protein
VLFAIYRNRRAFATTALARAYAAALWPDTYLSGYSTDKLRELVAACIERNIRLRRLTEILRGHAPADLWDTWELLYRVHAGEKVAVRLELAPTLSADATFGNPEDAWATVQRWLFEATGLLSPLLEVVKHSELSNREWRLCINDVTLPSRRRDAHDHDREAAMNAILGDLVQSAEALLTRDEVSRRLRLINTTFPVLVGEALRRAGLNRIVTILGMLVRNGTPVHDLERILDELTIPLVPYELEDVALQIVESPIDMTSRRKRGERERAATPEEYASALAVRLAAR